MPLHPDFLHELKKHFQGDLRLDPASQALYATDASMYQIEPLGVAVPKTLDDLQSAVELSVKHRIPILPRGSGTSLGGQAIGQALILDCSRYLNQIKEIDIESHSAVVEPGVVLATLNRAAADHGLMFGPDPASVERATMGGVIGNNATGAHSILYGMSADHLISADVILGDGSLETWDVDQRSVISTAVDGIREKYAEAIRQRYPRSWRNSAGYRLNYLLPWTPARPPQWDTNDYGMASSIYSGNSQVNMASLLAGSEGTLAIMRRARVNLVPRPKQTILGVLAYTSVAEACDDVPRLLTHSPSAIELVPQLIMRLARGIPSYARQMGWVIGDPAAVMVVEFSGNDESTLKEKVRQIGDLFTIAVSAEEQMRVWNVRKVGLGILDSRPQVERPVAFIEDCAIPVEHLGEFVREVERILLAHNTYGGIYAHASGGCLHIRPMLDLQHGDGVRSLRSIASQVLQLTLKLGGSMSSEHGDGIVRGEWLKQTYGDELIGAMRMLKRAADPHNLLNPDKMFDAPAMDTQLRYDANHHPQTWIPSLQFEHERGLAGAIEQCNGQGLCRKDGGVMCPSFQASREEAHNTRGRANLLRALINGTNAARPDMQEAVYRSLDLCLACKGCTSECPSGVDMPRLKYEFMDHYYQTHRRPLREYLFGYFHVIARWMMPVAPIANALMRMNWSHTLIAAVTGVTHKRPLPQFKRMPEFSARSTGGQRVIFLSDVFSHYLEPEVEQAAVSILSAAGYDVMVLQTIGAGASLLSKGFIQAAREHAEKVIREIHALDGAGCISVIGCEPPEIYGLKHEYSSLLPERRAQIKALSQRTWLIDEFLVRSEGLNTLRVATKEKLDRPGFEHRKITFQPHCHQRAEGLSDDGLPTGASATVELMRSLGFEVDLIDAGCCGMAGTFGYDATHYDLSMQIGELGVLPRAREAETIISTGSACRIQIRHGSGKEAKHPLVLLADLLRT
jgi:FAD/FMN-containing dehydrogenase/Fe-S oxidoreductase